VRKKGRITSWNDERGFGFVESFGGGDRTFIHIKAFRGIARRPVVGDVVTFTASHDATGRPRAADAALAGEGTPRRKRKKTPTLSALPAVLFLCVVVAAVPMYGLSPLVPLVYGCVSVLTFGFYAVDKWKASRGRWRVTETRLHLLSVIGGWPGAVLAHRYLRHKSRKVGFRRVFWATVVINCAGCAWLLTADGKVALDSLLVSLELADLSRQFTVR